MDDYVEDSYCSNYNSLSRVQEGHQNRASVCMETESGEASAQRGYYPPGESTSRLPLKENGCELHSDCFTCPFKDCIYDGSNRRLGVARVRKILRNAEIVRRAKLGTSNKKLAVLFGIGIKTIQRALGGC